MKDPGAPVELYKLLVAGDEPELIDREIPEDAEILELGCGSGRITHPLVARGRRVVAVDFNPEMLELIDGAETVLARVEDLELHRTFGGIVLMSNLINNPDRSTRLGLLATIRRHLSPTGVALVERYDPESGHDPLPTEHERYGVTIRVRDIHREGQRLSQTIDYDAGARGRWTMRFEGLHILSDDETLADLAVSGLRLLRWIDEPRRWFAVSLA